MTTCLNLKKLFEGQRFRFGYDESYKAERSEFRKLEKLWLTHILCRHGYIGVWGGNLLVACTDKRGIAGRLRSLKFVRVAQDGTDGVNAVFDLKYFDRVAEIMRPRRKRLVTEEQKVVLRERIAKYGKKPKHRVGLEAQICDGSTSLDPQEVQP